MEKFLEATYLDYCVLFKEKQRNQKSIFKTLQQKNFFYALKNRS